MPNIFKNILGSTAESYTFLDVEDIDVGALAQAEEDEENEFIDGEFDEAESEIDAENEFGEEGDFEADGESGEEFKNVSKFEGKNKPFTLELAKIEADEIVEDARQRADAIVSEAATGAKLLRFSAESEIKKARKEAYDEGYAEGLVEARVKVAAKMEAQVNEFLISAVREKDELLKKSQEEMCELALAIAEKIIQISLKSSAEVVARMIQVSIEKLKRREWVRIYVCDTDAQGIIESTPELTAALAGLSDNVKIVPLTDSEEGTCIIEMPDEIIDASVKTQMQNIRETIRT